MAIQIKYYSIVIPIINFSKCPEIINLSGVISFYTKRNKSKCIWHDDYLFVIGGIMNPEDVKKECKILEGLGLEIISKTDNESYWKDLCVIDFSSGPTLPCPWLESKIDPFDISYVWLKDKEIGVIIKPKTNQ